ncbi:MAG TPA: PEP-CTERM system TPR-repeat protein PrsT [Gammaproteobacteria bacterium]|nr:PEP-CTERM system TPR-repeat protein PrsT [Gammaproteobacteria bacterium]
MSRRSSRRRQRTRRRVAIGALLGVLLAAAAGAWLVQRAQRGSDEALAAARQYLEDQAPARAVPLLRAVVQARPKDGVARELLAQALLASGDAGAALKELRRALALGRDTPDNRLALARAHLLRGEFDAALARLAAARDEANPAWQLLSGEVRAAREAYAEALPYYAAALARDPDLIEAQAGLVRAQIALGRLDDARQTLAQARARKLEGLPLWRLEGQLALAQGRPEEALRAYAKVLAARPGDELALLGTAAAELAAQRHVAAAAALDRLPEAVQAGPRAQFLRAMIAVGRRDPTAALNHLRRVLAVAPEHRESLRQAASLHFQLGAYGDAEYLLRRLAKLDPDDQQIRHMLEAAQLAGGRFDATAYDLDALDRAAGQDPRMLALLGSALLRGGNHDAGEKALRAAREHDPDSLVVQRQLAIAQLAAGRFDEVLTAVPGLRERGDDTLAPDILTVAAELGRRDLEAARRAADALVARRGEDPFAHNVLAFVLETAGRPDEARAAYERALALAPAFDAAALNLARLDLAAGRPEEARARYRAILARQPDQAEALDGLAMLALADGKADRATELWQQARRAHPDALRPRLLLARQAREAGRHDEALAFVREAWRVAPFAPGVQLEYCLSLLAAGKNDDALPIARALARRFPGDGKLARLLAIAVARSGDATALRAVLEDMVQAAPDNLDARLALARLALQQRKADEARALIEDIAPLPGGDAAADELRGDLLQQDGDAQAAVAAYGKAYARAPTRELMLKLDDAERRAGQDRRRLAEWVETHAEDLQARVLHAGRLQEAGEDGAAIAEFERVLAQAPDSPVVRNNLAWLYRKIGDARALDMARKAFELAPRRAEVVDTYGWILLEEGRHEQALKILGQAVDLAPNNRDIRFHRARALERMGREEEALRELEALLRDPADFESRAQAEQLRYELQS